MVGKERYNAYLTELDKTFNTNRMPSWEELSEEEKKLDWLPTK